MTDPLRLPATAHDRDSADSARDALRRQVDFLERLAKDPDAPRGERLRALELLAQIAGSGGHVAGKSAGKHAAKHAVKHAAKHASKHASKHAAKHAGKHASKHVGKTAAKRVERGSEPKRLGQSGGVKRVGPGAAAPRALPPGR